MYAAVIMTSHVAAKLPKHRIKLIKIQAVVSKPHGVH